MRRYFGLKPIPVSHYEKIISALGGFVAILSVVLISRYFVGVEGLVYIVPSMGATAVLLFALPHSSVGQPWNVLGGHIISAIIGVMCAKYIPNIGVAAALSVGVSIGVMYYARCIHPPGGATALVAVIGGEQIHSLGFEYIWSPVLLNVLVIVLIALLFNFPFKWRRYPLFIAESDKDKKYNGDVYAPISHADFVYALSQIDSYIDVTEDDLLKIYSLATHKGDQPGEKAE